MSNPETGEVSLEIGGKPYRFVMDTDARCQFEAMFSTPQLTLTFFELVLRVQRGSHQHMRGFLWAALRRYHPEMTLDQVSKLIDEAGGITRLGLMFGDIAASNIPDPRDVQELGIDPNRPRKAQRKRRTTGERSTSPLAASV